jgi:hypothetical protein
VRSARRRPPQQRRRRRRRLLQQRIMGCLHETLILCRPTQIW